MSKSSLENSCEKLYKQLERAVDYIDNLENAVNRIGNEKAPDIFDDVPETGFDLTYAVSTLEAFKRFKQP